MFCQKKHFFYLKLHKYGREKGSFLYIQCPFFDFFYRCLDAVFSYGVFEEKLKFNHITISREDLNLKTGTFIGKLCAPCLSKQPHMLKYYSKQVIL